MKRCKFCDKALMASEVLYYVDTCIRCGTDAIARGARVAVDGPDGPREIERPTMVELEAIHHGERITLEKPQDGAPPLTVAELDHMVLMRERAVDTALDAVGKAPSEAKHAADDMASNCAEMLREASESAELNWPAYDPDNPAHRIAVAHGVMLAWSAADGAEPGSLVIKDKDGGEMARFTGEGQLHISDAAKSHRAAQLFWDFIQRAMGWADGRKGVLGGNLDREPHTIRLELGDVEWMCQEYSRYDWAVYRDGVLVALCQWDDTQLRVEPMGDESPPDDELTRIFYALMKRETDAPRTLEV